MPTEPDPSRPEGAPRLSPRAAADQRAAALLARLEAQVALAAAERDAALAIVRAPGVVTPHRYHHLYALGADQATCGLTVAEAQPMRGLMSIGPLPLADLLDEAAIAAPGAHVTRLWRSLLDADQSRYRARGAKVDAGRVDAGVAPLPDRRLAFGDTIDRVAAAEVHRDEHAFALGADLVLCGLSADDALALQGLMSAGPARVAAELRRAAGKEGYVARLWLGVLARSREEYEARGAFVRWQRRWARYAERHAAWVASASYNAPDWRDQSMTPDQRATVRDTAILLGLDLPAGMTCGAAHDWLQHHGGNAVYRGVKG